MKSSFYECFSRFYFAGDALTDAPLCSQGDQRSFWALSIPFFNGRL
jgi:hypothetical protein